MTRFAMAVFAILLPCQVQARDSEALTMAGAVLCTTPFQITEGLAAARRGDTAWAQSIGCVVARENVRVILVDPNAPLGRPWQVRIIPDNGEPAVTAWGDSTSFKSKSGKSFWPSKLR